MVGLVAGKRNEANNQRCILICDTKRICKSPTSTIMFALEWHVLGIGTTTHDDFLISECPCANCHWPGLVVGGMGWMRYLLLLPHTAATVLPNHTAPA